MLLVKVPNQNYRTFVVPHILQYGVLVRLQLPSYERFGAVGIIDCLFLRGVPDRVTSLGVSVVSRTQTSS